MNKNYQVLRLIIFTHINIVDFKKNSIPNFGGYNFHWLKSCVGGIMASIALHNPFGTFREII
jgi:hypothetical protein